MFKMTSTQIEKFARDNEIDVLAADKAARWFYHNAYDYQDRRTAEVDYTRLAEAYAAEFEVYEPDSDWVIPEWLFELAAMAG